MYRMRMVWVSSILILVLISIFRMYYGRENVFVTIILIISAVLSCYMLFHLVVFDSGLFGSLGNTLIFFGFMMWMILGNDSFSHIYDKDMNIVAVVYGLLGLYDAVRARHRDKASTTEHNG